MKISIIAVGRLKKGPETALFERYEGRIKTAGKSVGISALKLTEIAEAGGGTAVQRCAAEAEKILAVSRTSDFPIALDVKGKRLTSLTFADLLSNARDEGCRSMAFLIGGADGHGAEIEKKSRMSLSMSDMTLPHGLARIVLAEQIYRAVTIMAGHPYHRE